MSCMFPSHISMPPIIAMSKNDAQNSTYQLHNKRSRESARFTSRSSLSFVGRLPCWNYDSKSPHESRGTFRFQANHPLSWQYFLTWLDNEKFLFLVMTLVAWTQAFECRERVRNAISRKCRDRSTDTENGDVFCYCREASEHRSGKCTRNYGRGREVAHQESAPDESVTVTEKQPKTTPDDFLASEREQEHQKSSDPSMTHDCPKQCCCGLGLALGLAGITGLATIGGGLIGLGVGLADRLWLYEISKIVIKCGFSSSKG